MKHFLTFLTIGLLATATPASAQWQGVDNVNEPRVIEALDTVVMEDMTFMEIRDAIRAGKTTAIVGTGGLEARGPYVTISNHNNSIRVEVPMIARRLGNALVAPMIGFGPAGAGTEVYPGTFGFRVETFKMAMTDICTALKRYGFKNIILIGDNGGNQTPMKEVAAELNKAWAGSETVVHHVPEYYATHRTIDKALPSWGIKEVPEKGVHDSFRVEALMMLANPDNVRLKQRMAAGKTTIVGVDLLPVEKTLEIARKMLEMKVAPTVEAIRKVVAQGRGSQ